MNPSEYNLSELDAPSTAAPVAMPLWKEVLLWIAFLPAAIAGSAVVFWTAKLLTWLGSSYYGDDTWLYVLVKHFITNAAYGYSFICCGAFVAPRGKTPVAVTLAGLILLVSGLSVLVSIIDHRWMDLLATAALITGAVVRGIQVAKGQHRFDWPTKNGSDRH